MPTSEFSNIPGIINEVMRLDPEGIIELGVGCGKYGVLCREALDGGRGRVQRPDWVHRIVGIEGFREYANPIWNAYDSVQIGDFRDYYSKVIDWPLVMMIDSLEHVEMTEAKIILDFLVRNNKAVVISVPLGECPQGTTFGNELETHRSTWTGCKDFEQYNYRVLHEAVCLVVSIEGVRQ